MLQRIRLIQLSNFLLLALLIAPAGTTAQKQPKKEKRSEDASALPKVIWRDPGNIADLNLFYGAGGEADAPDPNGKFTFEKEDMEGTSPKFDVRDDQGRRWRVKLGAEPQAETAATRLLWAVGYYVDEDYYLPELKVEGLPKLKRGENFISADGTVHGARLKLHVKGEKKLGNWDWFSNPFVGEPPFNGLKIMMALLNNWDLKMSNNAIREIDGEQEYLVSDVGASFGKTGNSLSRSKGVPQGYVESKFIEKVTPDYVDFVMHSRPFFLTVLNVPNYQDRTRMERIPKHIPRSDAAWLSQRLSALSDDQIRDCFRAAGYTPHEIDEYTAAVRKRIEDLKTLGQSETALGDK